MFRVFGFYPVSGSGFGLEFIRFLKIHPVFMLTGFNPDCAGFRICALFVTSLPAGAYPTFVCVEEGCYELILSLIHFTLPGPAYRHITRIL
jgi:hypothetical protein